MRCACFVFFCFMPTAGRSCPSGACQALLTYHTYQASSANIPVETPDETPDGDTSPSPQAGSSPSLASAWRTVSLGRFHALAGGFQQAGFTRSELFMAAPFDVCGGSGDRGELLHCDHA